MPGQDLASLSASMCERILGSPAQPLTEGGYALRVLRTTGRRSGEQRSTPMGVVVRGGHQYLVCPDPGRDWARNLAADPHCVIASADGEEPRTTVAAPDDEAAPVVALYLDAMRDMPFATRSFPVEPGATAEEIRPHLGVVTVWRLGTSQQA